MKNIEKIAKEILSKKTIQVIQYDKSKTTENEFKNYLKKYDAKVKDFVDKDYGLKLEIELPSYEEKDFVNNLPKNFEKE